MMIKLLSWSLLGLVLAENEDIECPVLTCDGRVDVGYCFVHDVEVPTQEIRGTLCYDEETAGFNDIVYHCPFNLASQDYMWIDERLQGQELADQKIKNESQIQKKMNQAQCKEVISTRKDLHPGRKCSGLTSNNQCESKFCYELVCKGLKQGKQCHSHKDCMEGTYCNVAKDFPYASTCQPQKDTGELCDSDFQCMNSHFCWFVTPEDKANNIKKCLETYSQDTGIKFGWHSADSSDMTFEDYERNGMYCKSGLAYNSAEDTATCTYTTGIQQDGVDLQGPQFSCNPISPLVKCHTNFFVQEDDETYVGTSTKSYVQSTCKCAMTTATEGYCGSIIGTETYQKAMRAMQLVKVRSSCHTLDRNDLRAQKDACGIGTDDEEWRFAVDQVFNITHWPYVQNTETYHCVQQFFSDSFTNLSLEMAIQFIPVTALVIMSSAMVYLV